MAKTLKDLVELQIYKQEDTTASVDALSKEFRNYFKVLERGKLPSEEDRRERNKKAKIKAGGSDSSSGAGGGLLGGLFGSIMKGPLSLATMGLGALAAGPLAFILRPLKLIAKIVARGGPLGAVIALMYGVFQDIGENENFKKAMEQVKETWQKVKTAFDDLKETFDSITNENSTTGNWLKVALGYFKNLRMVVQDLVSNTITNVFAAVGNSIDMISSLLSGDFQGAWESLKDVFGNITNQVDDMATAIFKAFGIDFGEDGTLFGYLEGVFSRLNTKIVGLWFSATEWIKEKWATVTSTVKDFWSGIVNFFTGGAQDEGSILYYTNQIKNNVKDKGVELIDAFTGFVSDTWTTIKGLIPNPAVIARNLSNKVLELAPDWVKEYLNLDQDRFGYYDQGMERGRGNYDSTEKGFRDFLQQNREIFDRQNQGQNPLQNGVRFDASGAIQVAAPSYAQQFASTPVVVPVPVTTPAPQTSKDTSTKIIPSPGRPVDYYHFEKRLGGRMFGMSLAEQRILN